MPAYELTRIDIVERDNSDLPRHLVAALGRRTYHADCHVGYFSVSLGAPPAAYVLDELDYMPPFTALLVYFVQI